MYIKLSFREYVVILPAVWAGLVVFHMYQAIRLQEISVLKISHTI